MENLELAKIEENQTEEKFDKIINKFDSMIKKWEIVIEPKWDTFEVNIVLKWKKELVWYIIYEENKGSLNLQEFVTANFYNYSYADRLFDILSYNKEHFIDKPKYLKNKLKLEYLWVYMMYYIINFTKDKWYSLFKIMNPDNNAARFYFKMWKLFENNLFIKKYNLPAYETIDNGYTWIYQIKVINIEI